MISSIWSDVRSGGAVSAADHRSAFQRDYDRVLFSTPVRRLADKTQVFPLDKNDGVRTRLTHSHEVANLARSVGARLLHEGFDFGAGPAQEDTVLPILSTIGLAHDLGNPPFGHRGEAAIREWFKDQASWIFTHKDSSTPEPLANPVPSHLCNEFLQFDGNPQTLRLLTQLQTSPAFVGLDLSAATLAASLKYSVRVSGVNDSVDWAKKFGYFESEVEVVKWVRSATGLSEGQRHPLTWIMEACDDIAYSVLDVEDSIKKMIISPDDIMTILKRECGVDLTGLEAKFSKSEETRRPTPIVRDMKAGYFRAFAIEVLVNHAANEFKSKRDEIYGYGLEKGLMKSSQLCKCLKGIAQRYAFGNSEVLKAEAEGGQALKFLMECFWSSITNREERDIFSTRNGANDRFAFSLISHNYIDATGLNEKNTNSSNNFNKNLPDRYWELRLLTDMMAGMTDTFCIDLYKKMRPLYP